jgi:hypothetical protein
MVTKSNGVHVLLSFELLQIPGGYTPEGESLLYLIYINMFLNHRPLSVYEGNLQLECGKYL